MSEIDWAKAPEFATKFGVSLIGGMPLWLNDTHYCYADEEYLQNFKFGDPGSRKHSDISVVEDRPIAWSGEGLPPAGLVCEWKEKTGFVWVAAEVLFISESSVVMKRADGFEWQMMTARTVFRPIRTPEKIEAEARSKECDRIYGILSSVERPGNRSDMAEALYDSGYRQVEQPK